MKQLATLALTLLAWSALGQWTYDPSNPGLVSNESNIQNAMQAQPDGQGGAYIMWLDTRNDPNKAEVYGQHVDAEGIDLWEEGGRLILTDSKPIIFFRFHRYNTDGKMIIGWYSGEGGVANSSDKLWFRELDEEGQSVWAADLAVSEESPDGALSVGSFSNVMVNRDALGFHVCMMINTYGYDRIRISRFTEGGTLAMPLNGVEIGPLDIGNVGFTGDGGTGAYVYYSTGNGAGAALMCMHIDHEAGLLWNNWVSVADANGLSYQFSAIGDATGITCAWQGSGVNQENLFARRLNSDGTFAWGGSSANLCQAPGSQTNFTWIKSGDDYYMAWADGRPGVTGYYAIYAQRFNTSGEVLWAEDGVEVADLNTYSPYARITRDQDGYLYITHQSTVAGFVVQKMNSAGEVLWDADGEQIATVDFNPNAWEHVEFLSGFNLVSVWVRPLNGGGTDGIYISKFGDTSPVVEITETVSACDAYEVNGEVFSESGTYLIELEGDTLLTLELTVLSSSESTQNVTACGPFIWNGEEYDASGTYVQVIPNAAGCDSIMTLLLVIDELEVSVLENAGVLSTSLTTGDSWLWIDCNTGETLAETMDFTPAASGSYQVEVEAEGCVAISDCYEFTYIGTPELTRITAVYPNPCRDRLFVDISTNDPYQIRDETGRVVLEGLLSRQSIDTSCLTQGTYIVSVAGVHYRFVRLN